MSELIVDIFPDPYEAADVLASMRKTDPAFAGDLQDAVSVSKDATGNVLVQQTVIPGADARQGSFLLLVVKLLLMLPAAGSGTITLDLAEAGGGVSAGRSPRERSSRGDDAAAGTRPRSAPLRYRTYLLRVWEERAEETSRAVYRLSLEDAHTHRRRGFDRPERLLAHLQGLIDEMRLDGGTRSR
jgi:hypothetical protein